MSTTEARLLALENAFAIHVHPITGQLSTGAPGNVQGWKAESLKLIGEMHEEAERLAKMADSLPAEIDQVAYWQRNAAYWKRQHEENVAAQMARAEKAEKNIKLANDVLDTISAPQDTMWERVLWLKTMWERAEAEVTRLRGPASEQYAALKAELAEERNHREKAENIARTAAKQRDEAWTEVQCLKNIVVDIGGIGGCQDKINPIKAVGVIAHLQAELQQAKTRISESDADCVKTLQERDELQKALTRFQNIARNTDRALEHMLNGASPDIDAIQDGCIKIHLKQLLERHAQHVQQITILGEAGRDARADAEKAKAERNALSNEYHDLQSLKEEIQQLKADLSRICTQRDEALNERDEARSTADNLARDILHVKALLENTHKLLNERNTFKKLVHERLDTMGIPKFEGVDCRIGARLDEVARRITLTHISESFGRAFGDALKEIADTWRKL